ncbi:DUF6603 domain-containing protein [Embleya sp. NPDC008237]|uniref:DUF6603 domain-containing protein n=1 Tax=Embleya sp. NPDC008237 TaxID=3363978 RepID=UPI0036E4A47E
MGMPICELRHLLDSASKDFVLSAETLDIADAEPLFTDYLGGDLDFADATGDSAGLSVSGDLALPGVESGRLPAIARFLTDDDGLAVIGVEVVATWPTWQIDLPYLTCDLSSLSALGFASAALALLATPNEEGVLVPGAMAALAFAGAGRAEHLLMAQQELTGVWRVVGYFADRLTFASLTSLAALPFVDAEVLGDAALPDEIQDILSSLSLVSIGGAFDTRTGRFREITLDLRLDTSDWAVLPGVLTLDELRLWLHLMTATPAPAPGGAGWLAAAGPLESGPPGGGLAAAPLLRGGLSGRCRLDGGYVLEAAATFPDVYLTASVSNPTGGADLIGDSLEGTGLPSGIALRRLAVGCAPRSGVYTLALALDTNWEFADGLELEELSLQLTHGGAATDVAVTGVVDLDGVPLILEARRGADGWAVAGSAYGIGLDAVAGWFATTFDVPLPGSLAGLELTEVHVALNSKPAGSVTLTGTLPLGDAGNRAAFTLDAQVARDGAGKPSVTFSGSLDLVVALDDTPYPMRLDMELDHGGTGTAWSARWNATDRAVPLFAMLAAVGVDGIDAAEQVWPAALRPALRSLGIVYDSVGGRTVFSAAVDPLRVVVASGRDPQGRRVTAVQVVVAAETGLSSLPLLEGMIPPAADLMLHGIRLLYTSAPVPAPLVAGLNAAIVAAGSELTLPALEPGAGSLGAGTWLAVDYTLPGLARSVMSFQLAGPRPPGKPPALEPARTSSPPQPSTAPGAWLDVGRAFGPLHVARIGLAYTKGTMWLMVDASLSAAGVTIGVAGLGLGIDLNGEDDAFPVRTRLDGLGVGFERPPLHVAGALVSRPDPPEWPVLVQGSLTVELAPKLSVLAIGSYQKSQHGQVSLFVFGRAAVPFGGPPPFHVTGFALGFGYQSSVRIPEQHEIGTFPLVKGLDDDDFPADPLQVLTLLTGGQNPWVKPTQGQIWLAGGLDFTSFEFVRTRVLLLLEAGNDLTLALIGRANASFPKTGTAYARIGVDLRVVYQSKRGELAVTAQLVDSYVIDPACVLTGGFAFYLWSGRSAYAGDFVVTVGGYHPHYKVPAHFPVVPRLGFSWSLGSVSITGGSYFALTPNAVMAGGMLDVRYRSGNVEAWLTAKADILVQWAPLSFRAGISISVGVKVKLLFTLRGELGASLDLWGPPTGGTVTAKFVFITVTVRFGAQHLSPPPLTWPEFAAQLLPEQVPLTVTASTGLLTDADSDPELRAARVEAGEEPWLVDPAAFSFAVETVVPTRRVRFDTREDVGEKGVDIRPMGLTGLDGLLHVRVEYKPTDAGRQEAWRAVPGLDRWIVEPQYGRVPFSVWGDPAVKAEDALKPGHEAMLTHLTGLRITVPPHQVNGQDLGPIAERDLLWERLPPDAPMPLDPADPPTGSPVRVPTPAGAGVAVVADHLATLSSSAARTRLHGALAGLLGHDDLPNATLGSYAEQARTVGLDADPLLLTHDTAPPPPESALLVLDDTTASVLAVDPDTGTLLGRARGLAPGPYLTAATPDGARLYIAGTAAGRLDVLDNATLRLGPPLTTDLRARAQVLALKRDATRLIAAAPAAQSIAAVSVDLTGAREPVATDAYDAGLNRIDALTVDAESGRLYTVETNTSKTAAFDTETGIYIGHVPEPSAPLRVSAVPGQDVLFVYGSEQGGNGIVQVRPRPPATKHYEPYRFPKKGTAKAMLVDTDNQAVLARAYPDGAGHLATFAVQNGTPGSTRLVSDVALDTAPVALALDPRNRRWVLHAAAVSVVDGATPRGTLTLDAAPLAIAFSADAARAYLVCADAAIAVVEIGDTGGPHVVDRWNLPAGTVASAALFTLFTATASTQTAFTPIAPEGTAR